MNYCLHDPITPSPSGSLVLMLSHCNVATHLWHKPFTVSSAELAAKCQSQSCQYYIDQSKVALTGRSKQNSRMDSGQVPRCFH